MDTLDTIELRRLTYYGYHGALPEEQRLGQRFVVSLHLGLDLASAGRTDDLSLTVDYDQVAQTVRDIVEGRPFRLIEALAEAIAIAILDGHPLVRQIDVAVEKPSAPVAAAPAGTIAVQIRRTRDGAGAALAGAADQQQQSEPIAPTQGSVLGAESIRQLLQRDPPLLDPLDDPSQQIQPNGVDLTLESIWRIDGAGGAGAIGVAGDSRIIPDRAPVAASADGWCHLLPGTYMIRFREAVALPLDLMAFGRSRSSLLRCGAAIHTAVWDAGYHGRSEALLVVYAAAGIRLQLGARALQLVFLRLEAPTYAYAGAYQQENLTVR
jgi:dUTP pyrophosphatase